MKNRAPAACGACGTSRAGALPTPPAATDDRRINVALVGTMAIRLLGCLPLRRQTGERLTKEKRPGPIDQVPRRSVCNCLDGRL
jgi:hypothetical protein